MLYKLVDSASFFRSDEPAAKLINFDAPGDLTKSASHDLIQEFVSKLIPKDDKFYLHINAMGAGEYYGSNKNGDYFPEEQLIQFHKTFEAHGYVYRHHINKDPAKSMGRVIFAIYNHAMHRVELIAEVSKQLGQDILSRIEDGDYPFTSMACKTPYDVCSICGNKAHTRQEYCDHLTTELNKIYPDGKRVMALNLGPLRFFDISIVIRPADITSSILMKVASDVVETISSVDMAEIEELPIEFYEAVEKRASEQGIDRQKEVLEGQLKEAAVSKLAELIKEIDDGRVVGVDTSIQQVLDKVVDPDYSFIEKLLKLGGYNQVMNAFAEEGVSPSIPFLVELMLTAQGSPHAKGSAEAVTHMLSHVNFNDLPADSFTNVMAISSEAANPFLRKVVREHLGASSLTKVAYYWEQYVGPKRAPPKRVESEFSQEVHNVIKSKESEFKTLLMTLIGAAIISKFALAKLHDEKQQFRENQLKSTYGNSGVGPIYKSASHPAVTTKLMEQCALHDLLNMRK